MNFFRKYWYLFLLALITAGLAVATYFTSQRIAEPSQVTPPESEAATPACTITFNVVSRPNICELVLGTPEGTETPITAASPATIEVRSKEAVKKFQLNFFNRDNLDTNNKPLPIEFTAGTPFVKVTETTVATTSAIFTIPLSEINKPDTRNNDEAPTRLQANAYVFDEFGNQSAEGEQCVALLSYTITVTTTPTPTTTATPTITPTGTPPPTSTPTRTPTPTVTPNPQCGEACTAGQTLSGYTCQNSVWVLNACVDESANCAADNCSVLPTSTRTPTPTQALACNSPCTNNTQCPSSMQCIGGFCRNPSCATQTDCTCDIAQATPTPVTPATPVAGDFPLTAGIAIITGIILVILGLAF